MQHKIQVVHPKISLHRNLKTGSLSLALDLILVQISKKTDGDAEEIRDSLKLVDSSVEWFALTFRG